MVWRLPFGCWLVQAKSHELEKQKIEAEVKAYKQTVAQLKRRTVRATVHNAKLARG